MSDSDAAPPSVGKQLARRRKDLDIPQSALAQMTGVTVTSISKAENDLVSIRRGKRSDWERALKLRPGTISRAYDQGTAIESLGETGSHQSYADLGDPHERAIWEIAISEADRRTLIDILRSDRRDSGRRSA